MLDLLHRFHGPSNCRPIFLALNLSEDDHYCNQISSLKLDYRDGVWYWICHFNSEQLVVSDPPHHYRNCSRTVQSWN